MVFRWGHRTVQRTHSFRTVYFTSPSTTARFGSATTQNAVTLERMKYMLNAHDPIALDTDLL